MMLQNILLVRLFFFVESFLNLKFYSFYHSDLTKVFTTLILKCLFGMGCSIIISFAVVNCEFFSQDFDIIFKNFQSGDTFFDLWGKL